MRVKLRVSDPEATGSSGGRSPSFCSSFLACLIALAFCFSSRLTGISILYSNFRVPDTLDTLVVSQRLESWNTFITICAASYRRRNGDLYEAD